MAVDRATGIKLCALAGLAGVAAAGDQFGLGTGSHGILPALWHLGREGALLLGGHLGTELVVEAADAAGERIEHSHASQNRDLHRLIGETIARILERRENQLEPASAERRYLNVAVAAFRQRWMIVPSSSIAAAIREPGLSQYFAGNPDTIKNTRVLSVDEWQRLVQDVAGSLPGGGVLALQPDIGAEVALRAAAHELREHFAFELWEAAKHAWRTDDLAWPALTMRLLSEILGHAREVATGNAGLAADVRRLSDQVLSLAEAVHKVASSRPPSSGDQDDNTRLTLAFLNECRLDMARKNAQLDAILAGQKQIIEGVEQINARSERALEKLDNLTAVLGDRLETTGKAEYLQLVARSLAPEIEERLVTATVRELGVTPAAPVPLLDAIDDSRQAVVLTNTPSIMALQLMGMPRAAARQGVQGWDVVPITSSLAGAHEWNSRVRPGELLLVCQIPANAAREAADHVPALVQQSKLYGHRLVIVSAFGDAVDTLDGVPLLVAPYENADAPPLAATVHVDVDRNDTRDPVGEVSGHTSVKCRIGQSWSLRVRLNSDCFLTVFCRGTTGNVYRVFLNPTDSRSFVRGGRVYEIPQRDEDFSFREGGPVGAETIQAFASREPMHAHVVRDRQTGYLRSSSPEELASVIQEFQSMAPEHRASADCKIFVVER